MLNFRAGKYNPSVDTKENYRPRILRACDCGRSNMQLFQKKDELTFLVACSCGRRAFAADDYKLAWELWNEKVFTLENAKSYKEQLGGGILSEVKSV